MRKHNTLRCCATAKKRSRRRTCAAAAAPLHPRAQTLPSLDQHWPAKPPAPRPVVSAPDFRRLPGRLQCFGEPMSCASQPLHAKRSQRNAEDERSPPVSTVTRTVDRPCWTQADTRNVHDPRGILRQGVVPPRRGWHHTISVKPQVLALQYVATRGAGQIVLKRAA
jgi:hypothetical protein